MYLITLCLVGTVNLVYYLLTYKSRPIQRCMCIIITDYIRNVLSLLV